MPARVTGLLSALVLRNAPATEPEFSVVRTALDLAVVFSVVLDVAFRVEFSVVLDVAFRVDFSVVLDVAFRVEFSVAFRLRLVSDLLPTERFGIWWTARVRLPRVLGRATDRDVAALAVK
jgi:hypothetical protein